MRPPESFIGQPIRSLQTMLRVIAEQDNGLESLIPDGIYGPETVRVVSAVQRSHGLPVTGVTDQTTWETIVALYEAALVEQDEAQHLQIVLDPGQVIRKGERHPHLYLVQAMLIAFSEVYGSIPRPESTGILDIATEDALFAFQQLAGIPGNGRLDKHTWKHLVRQYPLAANLQTDTGDDDYPEF